MGRIRFMPEEIIGRLRGGSTHPGKPGDWRGLSKDVEF